MIRILRSPFSEMVYFLNRDVMGILISWLNRIWLWARYISALQPSVVSFPTIASSMWALMFVLVACSPGAMQPTITPTVLAREVVDIIFPVDGMVVYAETIYVSGTAEQFEDNTFRLLVVGENDMIIGEMNIQPEADRQWQVELPHGYDGDPIEVALVAVPNDGDTDYDRAAIVIAAEIHRPEGTFGNILVPFDGAQIGGEAFEVNGMASGVFEGQFTLELLGEDGAVIDRRSVMVFNPNIIDEVPWQAELATNGYLGPASIRMYVLSPRDGREIILERVDIIIGAAAG